MAIADTHANTVHGLVLKILTGLDVHVHVSGPGAQRTHHNYSMCACCFVTSHAQAPCFDLKKTLKFVDHTHRRAMHV